MKWTRLNIFKKERSFFRWWEWIIILLMPFIDVVYSYFSVVASYGMAAAAALYYWSMEETGNDLGNFVAIDGYEIWRIACVFIVLGLILKIMVSMIVLIFFDSSAIRLATRFSLFLCVFTLALATLLSFANS